MQGLTTFAYAVGQIFATLLPTLCYLAALSLFLFAGWGFWRQAQPDNPFRGKPWLPITGLLFCAGLSSYSSPSPASNLMGTTPADSVVAIVQTFQLFFQAFGAMMAFAAMYALWSTMRGTSRRTPGACFVQFVFAVMLINVVTISQWLVGFFT